MFGNKGSLIDMTREDYTIVIAEKDRVIKNLSLKLDEVKEIIEKNGFEDLNDLHKFINKYKHHKCKCNCIPSEDTSYKKVDIELDIKQPNEKKRLKVVPEKYKFDIIEEDKKTVNINKINSNIEIEETDIKEDIIVEDIKLEKINVEIVDETILKKDDKMIKCKKNQNKKIKSIENLCPIYIFEDTNKEWKKTYI